MRKQRDTRVRPLPRLIAFATAEVATAPLWSGSRLSYREFLCPLRCCDLRRSLGILILVTYSNLHRIHTPPDCFMALDEEEPSEKTNPRNDDAGDEWGPKPPMLVQGPRGRRPNQTAYGKTRAGDPKLTTERLLWDGVAPTRAATSQSRS